MGRRLLIAFAALVLLLGVGTAGGLWWLGTDAGLRFVIARLQETMTSGGNQLRLDGARGSLYRGVRIDRFEWQGSDGLRASGTGLVARWSLPALLRRQVAIPELAADTMVVQLAPAEPGPAPREATPMPGSFALPITIDLQRFAVAELRITPGGAAEPIVVHDIAARFSYHDAVFRLEQFGALTPYGSIDNGHAEIADAPPHALKAGVDWQGELQKIPFDLQLAATGDLEHLDASTTGSAADARISLDAKLTPLATMPLSSAQGNLANLDLQRLLPSAPQTLIDAEFSVAPDSVSAGWSGAVKLRNAGPGVWSDGKLPLLGLDARLAILNPDDAAERQLQIRDLVLSLPGASAQTGDGQITGSLDVFMGRTLTIAGAAIPEIKAALEFESIDASRFGPQLPPTALGGSLTVAGGDFTLALSQSEKQMRALSPTLLPASITGAAGAADVRIRGHFDATTVRLEEARVRLGQTELDASGEASLSPPHRVALKGHATRVELGQWLPRDTAIDERWRQGRISAAWSVDGTVAPGLDALLTLQLADSTLAGKPLAATVRSRLVLAEDWSPARIEKTAIDLRFGNNRIRANGALGNPSDQLSIDVSVSEPELLDPRLGGRFSLEGKLAGGFDKLRAQATLNGERLSLALPDGALRIGSARIKANGPATAKVPPEAPLDLSIRLRSVEAAGRKLDALDLQANGTLAAHRFNLALAGEGQAGKLRGDGAAALGETPSWRAKLAAATVDGTVPVRLIAPADIRVDAGGLRIDRFNVAVAGGEARLERLVVDWGTPSSGRPSGTPSFDSRGTAKDLPVTRLLDIAGTAAAANPDPAPDPLRALRALRLDASWNLAGSSVDDLNGDARIALREVGAREGPKLGLDGDNGVRVTLKEGRLDGRFNLDLPSLAFTHRMTAPDLVIDGHLRLAGSVGGTAARPLWDATLSGSGLSVLQRSVGWRLTDGVLSARLEGRKLQLQTLEFAAGEGSVELRGQANLLDAPRPGAGRKGAQSTLPIDGRFELTASHFQVPIGPGQRVALSGTTTLASAAEGLSLRGKLRVDDGIIEIQGSSAPMLPADVKVIRAGAEKTKAAGTDTSGEKPKSAIRILTNLAVDLGDRLRVTGNGVAARLAGHLEVLGTLPDDPKLTGVVNVVEGSYQAYGQNLRIEKGTVRFNGPIDNPALDLVAKRPFLPVEVGVAVTGNALNPQIALVSKPDMSETDKLSWLVLGTDPANAPSAAQSLALRQAARSLLMKDDGRYKPGIAERLGLDVMNFGYGSDTGPVQGVTESRNPTGLPGGQGASASAAQQEVVTLGKRIGSRLFVSYEQGVRGLYNLLRIQYALSQRLSVRAQSGSDNAVDLLYSYSFD